jgi:hypothetical protein
MYGGDAYLKVIDTKETVENFLLAAHTILDNNTFDVRKNFYFIPVRASGDDRNKETLLDLNYNTTDVVNEIRQLTVKNYKETIIDNMPGKKAPFFCFVKFIVKDQVYIKFKISEVKDNQVFCVSFHYVDYFVKDSEFPYK